MGGDGHGVKCDGYDKGICAHVYNPEVVQPLPSPPPPSLSLVSAETEVQVWVLSLLSRRQVR